MSKEIKKETETKEEAKPKKEVPVKPKKEVQPKEKSDKPSSTQPATAPAEKKASPAKKSRSTTAKKSKKKVATARGKRKEAIARATVRDGKGNYRINKTNINAVSNRYLRELMREPLNVVPDIAAKVDIEATVSGGGEVGQAQAVRSAVARAIYGYSEDENVKAMFLQRDRFMFVEDSRRVEPKKYLGPKARAKKQKSYR